MGIQNQWKKTDEFAATDQEGNHHMIEVRTLVKAVGTWVGSGTTSGGLQEFSTGAGVTLRKSASGAYVGVGIVLMADDPASE